MQPKYVFSLQTITTTMRTLEQIVKTSKGIDAQMRAAQ